MNGMRTNRFIVMWPANPSLERTPPRREFMVAVAQRRRSARDR